MSVYENLGGPCSRVFWRPTIEGYEIGSHPSIAISEMHANPMSYRTATTTYSTPLQVPLRVAYSSRCQLRIPIPA